jgi:S-DNA-T family DNA segregation ATPase FtsK/SpoIIIE
VVAVTPRQSPLSGLDGRRGATVVDADAAGELDEALARCRAVGRPPVVLVDDVESLDGRPAEAALARLVAEAAGSASQSGPMVVGAGSTPELLSRFQGLCVQLRRPGSGLVLGPAGPTDGDVLGVRLPRREVRHPGRGVLVHRGASTMVQVALPGRSAAYAGTERTLDGEEPARSPDGRTHRR